MFWKVIESIQIVYVLLIYVIHQPPTQPYIFPSIIHIFNNTSLQPSIHPFPCNHPTPINSFIPSIHPSIPKAPCYTPSHQANHPSIHPSILMNQRNRLSRGVTVLQTTQRMSRFCFRKHLLLFVSVAKPPPRDHMVQRGLDGTAQRNSVHWCQCGWRFLRHRFDPQTLAGASVHSHCFDDTAPVPVC